MKALCWLGKNRVAVEQVPDPRILNPRDAIIKITTSAICGSDLHLLDGFIPSMERGDILGHEFMGEVVEKGPEVKNLNIGDRVVVPFTISCGELLLLPEAALVALRQLQPGPAWPRRCTAIRARASSATRTSTAVMRAARRNTPACPSRTSARSRSPTA